MKKHILIPLEKYQALMACSSTSAGACHQALMADSINVDQDTAVGGVDNETIVNMMPLHARGRAKTLLSLLKGNLAWNPRGEILINTKPVQGSHIADLLRFVVVKHFGKLHPPIGCDEFLIELGKLNVPKSLFMNGPIQPAIQTLPKFMNGPIQPHTVPTPAWFSL